jgi:hypothetical protein
MLEDAEPFDVNREVAIQEQAGQVRNHKRQQEDLDLQSLMDTAHGRRFMWRLFDLAGVFRLSYAGEATHATAFAEGGRQIGNVLLADVHRLCPGKYELMVLEHQSA